MSPPPESAVGHSRWPSVELPQPLEPRPEISHVLFDFDGTLSLIRQGWPEVMVPMFIEALPRRPGETESALRDLVLDDIMRLNGKQTIYQMIQLAERVNELEQALAQVRQLSGLIPICAWCKKVRNDQNFWQQVEDYVGEHSHVKFNHSMCPDCFARQMAELKAEGG